MSSCWTGDRTPGFAGLPDWAVIYEGQSLDAARVYGGAYLGHKDPLNFDYVVGNAFLLNEENQLLPSGEVTFLMPFVISRELVVDKDEH